MAAPAAPQFGPALADGLKLVADAADALLDAPTVQLELFLAGALEPDAAFLALQMRPEPAQAGNQIVELGQLDLEAALQRLGALGEDVENELGAVHHAHAEDLLEGSPLGGRKIVVEDDELGSGGLDVRRDLERLAPANVGGRMEGAQAAQGLAGDLGAGRVGQSAQFAEGILDLGARLVSQRSGDQPGELRSVRLGGMHHGHRGYRALLIFLRSGADLFREPVHVPVGEIPALPERGLPSGGLRRTEQLQKGGELGGAQPLSNGADQRFGLPVEGGGTGLGPRIRPQGGQLVEAKQVSLEFGRSRTLDLLLVAARSGVGGGCADLLGEPFVQP